MYGKIRVCLSAWVNRRIANDRRLLSRRRRAILEWDLHLEKTGPRPADDLTFPQDRSVGANLACESVNWTQRIRLRIVRLHLEHVELSATKRNNTLAGRERWALIGRRRLPPSPYFLRARRKVEELFPKS